MHDFATYFGSKPSWNSCQFEIITQNNTTDSQIHDFVTYFVKLRPTTRQHNNKTKEKRIKNKHCEQKQVHSIAIFQNTLFPEPLGVAKTSKNFSK